MQIGQTLFNDFQHPHTIRLDNSLNYLGNLKSVPQWEPYEFNAGTVAAISGKDCVVIAGDTRVSRG
jgi:20S proteasome alpha/beta subunit